jgi:hypothetical protein
VAPSLVGEEWIVLDFGDHRKRSIRRRDEVQIGRPGEGFIRLTRGVAPRRVSCSSHRRGEATLGRAR